MGIYRQGDVFLIPTIQEPTKAISEEREKDGDIILAHGEVTGHAHRIQDKKATTFFLDGKRYLLIETPTDLTHEEHATITLPPGSYEVRIQREYTPDEIRNVAD